LTIRYYAFLFNDTRADFKVSGGTMVKIELSKAKEELSNLISLVSKGERVIIIKNNKPVADLVKHEMQNERRLGLLRGRLSIPENFNDEDDEINSMFYGKQS